MNRVSGVQAGRDIAIHNIREAQRRTVTRRFSFEDGREVTEIEEQRAVEYFRDVEGEADGLVRHLEDRRVLLISAPPGARKVTAAIGLAQRLRDRRQCTKPAFVFDRWTGASAWMSAGCPRSTTGSRTESSSSATPCHAETPT